jgi:hypothetical protein
MSPTALFALALLTAAPPVLAQDLRVPVGTPGTVTLSRTEYDRLLDLASTKPPRTDVAPVAAALTRADIHVRVDTAAARATMRVDGEAFRPGVSKVILIKNATLLDARMDNRALPIVVENGAHIALVSGPSTFAATLETGSPLVFAPGRASFTLPVPDAGSATATIDVPGEQADVRITGGLILRRASANGRTTIDATLTPGTPTDVSWSTHDSAPGNTTARDVRLLSDIKSVVTIADAEVRLVSVVNANLVAGEPSQIVVSIPSGYEVVSVSGPTLDRSEIQTGRVTLHLSDPSQRRHQFLLSLERPQSGGSFKLETGFPSIATAQRETGEIAIQGVGTMDVAAPEMPGLHRIDVRELDPSLTAVARDSLLAAFRYQSVVSEPTSLALDVHRYADAPVLAAVAERATATTLVTSEGRALTEVRLWLRNRAQRYMKVDLPEGASIVSVEVGDRPAKPVEGTDGNRVPLVRPGLDTSGVYTVSFVYLHAGTPFGKKGDMKMTLPKMDVPINLVEWEMFVPEQFRVDHFDGNLIDADLMPQPGGIVGGVVGGLPAAAPIRVGGVTESITVNTDAPLVDTMQAAAKREKKDENEAPSMNVQNLQRRAAGVLPVRVDVPRAGTSHRFVKPLVIDEQAEVTFRYKRR